MIQTDGCFSVPIVVEVVSNPILGKKSEFVKKLDRHFPQLRGGFSICGVGVKIS